MERELGEKFWQDSWAEWQRKQARTGIFNLWNVNLEKSSGKTAGRNDNANRLEQGFLTYGTWTWRKVLARQLGGMTTQRGSSRDF